MAAGDRYARGSGNGGDLSAPQMIGGRNVAGQLLQRETRREFRKVLFEEL
jgi:hypothetical protein